MRRRSFGHGGGRGTDGDPTATRRQHTDGPRTAKPREGIAGRVSDQRGGHPDAAQRTAARTRTATTGTGNTDKNNTDKNNKNNKSNNATTSRSDDNHTTGRHTNSARSERSNDDAETPRPATTQQPTNTSGFKGNSATAVATASPETLSAGRLLDVRNPRTGLRRFSLSLRGRLYPLRRASSEGEENVRMQRPRMLHSCFLAWRLRVWKACPLLSRALWPRCFLQGMLLHTSLRSRKRRHGMPLHRRMRIDNAGCGLRSVPGPRKETDAPKQMTA